MACSHAPALSKAVISAPACTAGGASRPAGTSAGACSAAIPQKKKAQNRGEQNREEGGNKTEKVVLREQEKEEGSKE